ncbi:hypothetical protein MYCO108962_26270 [Mycobacterium colombiense]
MGSAVIAPNTRSNRSTIAWMVSVSNTSVRNSTVPEMPAGSPASVQRSLRKKTTSIFAVWVSPVSGVTWRSFKLSPVAESLTCPGKLFQANTTWISG